MLNKEISFAINQLRFPLMLMIVLIHSYIPVNLTSTNLIIFDSFQTFLSQVVSRIAVPLYFVISSYLLYENYSFNDNSYWYKIKKRGRSLLIPFLFWNISVFFLFFSLQKLPFFEQLSSGNLINLSEASFSEVIYLIFIRPIANQFWFIRDLLILVVLSPLIFFLIQRAWIVLLFFSFILMVLFQQINIIEFKWDSLFFFSFGAFLSLQIDVNKTFKIRKTWFWLSGFFFFFFSIIETIYFMKFSQYIPIFHYLNIFTGIIFIWNLFLRIRNIRVIHYLNIFGGYSFIIYALHIPLNLLIFRVLRILLPTNAASLLFIYLITIIVCILFSIAVGIFMKRYTTYFYSIVTGNRN